MSIFEEVKNAVPMPGTARFYGFTPNRAGFIRCPFHTEKTASLKLYDRSFHCYGCGAGGSVIDFVAKLFNLDPLGAAKRLNEDFALGIEIDHPPDLEELRERQRIAKARKLFDEWKNQTLNQLDACIRVANLADFESLTDAAAIALRWREPFEYWAGVLLHGNLENQIAVFRNRKGVERICKTILQNTPMKSTAA